jgi:hypothetical protein
MQSSSSYVRYALCTARTTDADIARDLRTLCCRAKIATGSLAAHSEISSPEVHSVAAESVFYLDAVEMILYVSVVLVSSS